MLVHGNRPEDLRDLLVAWMRRYPLAPLETEIVLAQSNGIAQWLKLALAADADPGSEGRRRERGLGIAAALEISLPSRFLWRVYRAVLGRRCGPGDLALRQVAPGLASDAAPARAVGSA